MMRLLCVAALLFLGPRNVDASTFGEVLGLDGVRKAVSEETSRFGRDLEAMAKARIEVGAGFEDDTSSRISKLESPPEKGPADLVLRSRFRGFLANLAVFTLATVQKVVFNVSTMDAYLNAAGRVGRCGEFPCQSGCAVNRPCDLRCNSCEKK